MRRAPDELARIDRLFDGALSLSLEDRQTFLDRLDRTEPLLAADVRALLAAAERPEGTALWEAAIDNEWEAIAPGTGLLDDLNAGERIGPYRIVRLLGCGGMAPVYLAERADGVFAQQVALKLIPRDLLSADAVNRFTRERADPRARSTTRTSRACSTAASTIAAARTSRWSSSMASRSIATATIGG